MKISFVTPSFAQDFQRCRLLCESTNRFLPTGVDHVLLIDRRDMPLFRPLRSATVRIVESESIMPRWIFRLPGATTWWASLATVPIRNWIYQQLLKISAYRATDADVLQFVDSDVVLTRPFPVGNVVRNGRVRLQHVAFHNESHERWLEVGRRLLGIPPAVKLGGNYVGNLISWRRDMLLAMLARVEERSGKSWQRTIGSQLSLSEYMLYGSFVDHIVGLDEAGHFRDSSPNLAHSWDASLKTPAGLHAFFDAIDGDALGVMIHSKLGVPAEAYEARVRQSWARWD